MGPKGCSLRPSTCSTGTPCMRWLAHVGSVGLWVLSGQDAMQVLDTLAQCGSAAGMVHLNGKHDHPEAAGPIRLVSCPNCLPQICAFQPFPSTIWTAA